MIPMNDEIHATITGRKNGIKKPYKKGMFLDEQSVKERVNMLNNTNDGIQYDYTLTR